MSDAELAAIVGGSRTPAGLSREDRVRLLGEFSDAVLAGRTPSRESSMFVCAGISAWLSGGGSLEGDYWRVKAPAGSHHTAPHIWQVMRDKASSRGATGARDADTLVPPSLAEEKK